MATKFCGQLDPNLTKTLGVRQSNQAASDDVWVSQASVIDEWGLGQDDLWARTLARDNELLATGGVESELWVQFDSGETCTCIKEETGQVDQRCRVCYGVRFVGGFEKYGHGTLFFHANGANNTLTDLVLDARRRPQPLIIATGKDSGILNTPTWNVTENFGFTGFDLAAQDSLRKLTQDNVKVEYTLDSGNTFFDLSKTTEGLNEPSFHIRFRVTLTRNNDGTSPFFDIMRIRWACQRDTKVLISKKTFPEQRWLESVGVSVRLDGITWWTTPSLGIPDGPIQKIGEDDFFQIREGIYKPQTPEDDEFPHSGRYKPTNVSYVEPSARFISQRFNIRNLQVDEPENQVF